MFGLTGIWEKLAQAAIAVALLGMLAGGAFAIYHAGVKAGADGANIKNTAEMLDLQQKLNAKQSAEAAQINDRIDKVLTFSQDAVTAVEVYTDQGRTYSQSVLAAIKGKQLVSVVNGNCQFTPEFQDAWNKIRKGAAAK